MDLSMDDSIYEDDGSSDYVPDIAPKSKVKALKPASSRAAPKKPTATAKAKLASKVPAVKKRPKLDSEDEGLDDQDRIQNDSALSSTPPNASHKAKKIKALKKGASRPLSDVANESFAGDGSGSPALQKDNNASEKYQKLTQLEHIIKRPDTYIGSIEATKAQMWVFNSTTEVMEYRDVTYVPGLYKIFDEIVVNAADNKQSDQNMSEIRITVDRESGEISVWNNGRGIPIEIHSKEKIYVPELIFGHLLTSSNYDDTQQKVTGGRNGFGAKLCNVFSTEFTIETQDSQQKKRYKQTWTSNMSKMGKAKITDAKGEDYTKVIFKPDYAKFGMTGMDDDFEALVKRRVYDLAGTSKVTVKLNGTRIPVRNFKKYMEMYTKAIKKERGMEDSMDKTEIITTSPDPRWEIGFAVSDGSFQQVSFVNSIATTAGGTHVNYIADQICNRLAEQVKKKNKNGASLKTSQIKNHIFLFVNCLIVNPAFTSQTKEQLTTKTSQFGSKCVLDDDFHKKIAKTEVMNNILDFAEKKADQLLKRTDGNRRSRMNNPKLTDANKAGTKDGHHCTLILTEGDSAVGLAMAGRAVVGPDLFGVFPLRGKLLNVRDASIDQISKNAEIQNIKNIIGLQHKKEYTDTRGLRYGHLMLMTDQDHDGSHIKGLLINFLQVQFPSLLKIPEFLIEFITPIVKVWKGDPKNPTKSMAFFTMPEYEAWKEAHKHDRSWQHKYFKGLGTSTTDADAQTYFRDLDRHLKEFHTMQDHEALLIDLAFSKKKADERKEWLRQFKPGTYLDHSAKQITFTDFINKELILFSMADNLRSIPSVVDGLKPGQRKVLYTCFKRNIRKDIKVVELAGHVLGMAAYQHGDTSMQQTIVGLAQTFVGSNNVNYLEPSGNFGSRLQGGSDSASARYIYTRLAPFARKIFHPADEPLLTYNEDDGEKIEPEVYIPVVPTVLINGADGIGTGWSSSIPNYNPEDIVANLKRMMNGEAIEPMQPWFRGFIGEVARIGPDRFKFSGIVKETGDAEVEITELPIRTWTQDFKDKLEEIIKAEKSPSFIKDYKDYNTHTKVHFIIQMEEKYMKAAIEEGLESKFKLSKTIATSNLVAFDPEGRITKYASVDDILKEFYSVRIKYYEKRKQWQLSELQRELEKFTNQARFVQMIIDGELVIAKKRKVDLIAELKEKRFKAFPKLSEAVKAGETELVAEDGDNSEEDLSDSDAYNYLLGMPLWSLTKERVEKLRRQIGDREMEMDALIKLSKEDIWRKDLDEFLAEWQFQLAEEERQERKVASMGRRTSMKLMTGGRVPGARRRKGGVDNSDVDYAAPKPKKSASGKSTQPKGGLLNYLNKTSGKPPTKPSLDIDEEINDDDFLEEVLPKKKRSAPKVDKADDDVEMSTALPLVNPAPQSRASRKPVKYTMPSDLESGSDSLEAEIVPRKSRAAPKTDPELKKENKLSVTEPIYQPVPSEVDLEHKDDDVEMSAAQPITKPVSQGRANRKPVKYTMSSDPESGDDSEVEILPKKSRAAPKTDPELKKDDNKSSVTEPIYQPVPSEVDLEHKDDDVEMSTAPPITKPVSQSRANRKPVKYTMPSDLESDDDSEVEILPKKGRAAPKANVEQNKNDDSRTLASEPIYKPPTLNRPNRKPVTYTVPSDSESENISDISEAGTLPKKGRSTAKMNPKRKKDDDDIFEMAFSEPVTKPVVQSRTNRKPVKYTISSASESDSGDSLLDDVSKMVKGIGTTTANSASDMRTLFTEHSKPNSSAGLKTATKTSRIMSDFDPDETDYTKLVPQQSPRRSLLVKAKDVRAASEEDPRGDQQSTLRTSKPKVTSTKPKSTTSKNTAAKPRGRAKKDATN